MCVWGGGCCIPPSPLDPPLLRNVKLNVTIQKYVGYKVDQPCTGVVVAVVNLRFRPKNDKYRLHKPQRGEKSRNGDKTIAYTLSRPYYTSIDKKV